MLKKEHTILIAAVLILAAFIFSLTLIGKLASAAAEKFLKLKQVEIERLIAERTEQTFEKVREISKLPELLQLIESRDTKALYTFLNEERKKRGLDIMLAADSDGLVLTRTPTTDKHDDYLMNSAWGRKAMEQKPFVTFEIGQNIPLIFISSHPVKKGGEFIGTAAGGLVIDETFMDKFRKENFKNASIALYSREEGIIGGSFENPEILKILPTIFPSGGEWVRGEKNSGEAVFYGQYYFISNIHLKGLSENVGGFLLFLPISHAVGATTVGLVALAIFIAVSFFIHRAYETGGPVRKRAWLIVTFACGIAIFSLLFMSAKIMLDRKSISIKKPIYTIYNSTLELAPRRPS